MSKHCEHCKTEAGPFWSVGSEFRGNKPRFLFLCDPCLTKMEEETDPAPFVAYVRAILFEGIL
jgi:hypothetical protein